MNTLDNIADKMNIENNICIDINNVFNENADKLLRNAYILLIA